MIFFIFFMMPKISLLYLLLTSCVVVCQVKVDSVEKSVLQQWGSNLDSKVHTTATNNVPFITMDVLETFFPSYRTSHSPHFE